MYNKKVKFVGDIIITDPCYLMKDENETHRYDSGPVWWDFYSKAYARDNGTYYMPNDEDYDDAIQITKEEYKKKIRENNSITDILILLDDVEKLLNKDCDKELVWYSETFKNERKAYDEAKMIYDKTPLSDFERCNYGMKMEELGFTNYLCDRTMSGDWSCTVYAGFEREKIGEFCADSGMVGVFLLDDILKYNPDFDYHISKPWTTTLIKDFDGEIELSRPMINTVRVVGIGNVCFYSEQTGI